MAYAALVSLSQLLQQRTHYDQVFYISLGKKQQLKCLQEKVSFLQGFLDNYSQKGGETFQALEAQIRDTSYQVQDIIEYYISDRIRSDSEYCGVVRGSRQWMCIVQKVEMRIIRNKYEADLLKAVEQIDSVAEKVTNIQRSCKFEEMRISHTSVLASSSSAPNSRNKMVGFDDNLIMIKARLCGESSKLQIIPIVGMGGIGKTTLARNIFNDSLIVYHFHKRAWITISQQYNLREILLALLRSLTEITDDSSKTTNEELMDYVRKNLKGRTYLIIMDDMWNREAWDDLKRIFPDDNNGSQIMITTRLTDVADYASCSPIHHMHFLNENQSWSLLREKVFVEQSCPTELEEIGRMIAKTCGGLPLAISIVAGILKKVDRTQYHWENIAKNMILSMASSDEHFSKILSLSYDHLPNHLKACFLYMGGFREDYEIPVSNLIMLWVSEGFLKPVGSKSLEQVAEEYLVDLVGRNLVLVSKRSSNGKLKLCNMHDLLRDLCIRKAREENFLHVFDRKVYIFWRDIANQRRLTIRSGIYIEGAITNTGTSAIHSVLHFGIDWGFFSFVLRLRLLRVLHTLETNLYSFPVEITELFHLRYLALACREKNLMLFPALSKLNNIQTLLINPTSVAHLIPPLPLEIWTTPQIRHLILGEGVFQIPLAGGYFPVLENLQTLSGVANLKFTSDVLHMIPNVKKLKVLYTDKAKCSKLNLKKLVHLQQVETLGLNFFAGICFPVSNYALPSSLKKLTLRGCTSPSEDMSIIGSLPNLEVLKLLSFDFDEGQWESKEGGFPRLIFLLIEMSNLSHWLAESTHFPCLQYLIIETCWELEEIPPAIGDITTLLLI